MRNTKTTDKDLPGEIEALIPEAERTAFLKQLIIDCKACDFHDFKSIKYAGPKVELHKRLIECKDVRLSEIIADIESGIYDENPDIEDKEQLKKDWVAGGMSEESFNKIFGKK